MVQQHTAGLLRELIAFPWICFVERKYGGLQSNWNCHNGWATPVTKEHASASFDFWAFKCGSVTGEPVLHSTAASLVHTWAITSGPGSCRTSHYSSWQYNRHHGVGTMWLFNKFVKNDFSQMLSILNYFGSWDKNTGQWKKKWSWFTCQTRLIHGYMITGSGWTVSPLLMATISKHTSIIILAGVIICIVITLTAPSTFRIIVSFRIPLPGKTNKKAVKYSLCLLK